MIFDSIDKQAAQQTEYLLKTLASRLSGREDCRKVKYTVTIDCDGVRMSPIVYVYPNRYTRREGDKLDIISFIHQYRMNNTLLSGFVFGTYEYQLSADGKRRRWRKIK